MEYNSMCESREVIIAGISGVLGSIIARELANDIDVQIIGTMRRKRTATDKFPNNINVIDDCDLAKSECCVRVAETASHLFKGPFGFIHSVGHFRDHISFHEIDTVEANRIFESNATTFYNILHALVPVMKAKGGGSSIAFSCNSVRYNYPWMSSFTASKAALDSLVRSFANEFSGLALRFNSLELASLKTEKEHTSKPHGDFENFIPPEDLVPVIRFLLSPESYLVNGNSISLFKHSDQFYHTGYFERVEK
jgi:NAD(P)-dependent dehydrogenase (short-subunit alcohol dehydrogenase family)